MKNEPPPPRVVIEAVRPSTVDGGALKRALGDDLVLEFDAFADGHDRIACALRHRPEGETTWSEVAAEPLGNDRWSARVVLPSLGLHLVTVEGWVDPFASWAHDLERRLDAGQDVGLELDIGAALVVAAARRAGEPDRTILLEQVGQWSTRVARTATDPALVALMRRHGSRPDPARASPPLRVVVERERAARSAWYKVFPRSTFSVGGATAPSVPSRHGTLRDIAQVVVPHAAALGFDVLYLLPIHPIGRTHRKGPDNTLGAGPEDPGSPYAIGSAAGGHTAIAPELGTFDDLHALIEACRINGLELALDIAFQCSPDHPWVTEHPDWFRRRPDGSIMYAENPPKKYQDIYPLDLAGASWRALWDALRDVFLFWIGHGVTIFRVDNPHTKPFRFWEWAIDEIRREHPDTIFLAEAFTRPKVMRRLAKAGFTQSYTYFTWRTTKAELTEYFTELSGGEGAEYFRPNLWPNTPDILPFHLQEGGRPAFLSRAALAATLAASWGVYAPAFELLVDQPLAPGREEYARSEKYELKCWQLDDPRSIAPFLARLNAIRRDHPALWRDRSLTFHGIDNDRLIAYSKRAGDDVILCVVSLSHQHPESGWTDLDLAALGIADDQPFVVHDLLDGVRHEWHGRRNFVRLDPGRAHIFEVVR